MFPVLFVTIACGAVSGFHSLVSSGTASKQIKNEKHMLPVSYGAMLTESMLAVIALIACASFATGEAASLGYVTPAQIFAGGVAKFLAQIGLPHSVVFTLINLAVSAFALTSLDSVDRQTFLPGTLPRFKHRRRQHGILEKGTYKQVLRYNYHTGSRLHPC